MRKFVLFSLATFVSMMLTSCEAVETIFKAGMWWAFILVFLVIAVIIWLISKVGGKK